MNLKSSRRGAVLLFVAGLALGSIPLPSMVAHSSPLANKKPRRIVALTSLMADITARLDRSKLAGIPGSSLLLTNPNLRDLPKVSEGRAQPNLEKIIALKPDLVIGAKNFHEQVASRLNQLGIVTDLVNVDSWETLEKITKDLAIKLDANPEPLLNQYRTLIISKPNHNRRVLMIASRQPILSPNQKSWAGAMLDRFHLKNVAADLQGKSPFAGYVTLSTEKLLEINPDILIVVDAGENTLQWFQNQSFWRNLQAVKNNQIYQFEYYGLVNPGSIDMIVKAGEKLKAIALSA